MATSDYRYKLARSIKIGDVLYYEVEELKKDPIHPELPEQLVKVPRALVVSVIERDHEEAGRPLDEFVFIDTKSDMLLKAKPNDRLRLYIGGRS